jgi:hypothetical protein
MVLGLIGAIKILPLYAKQTLAQVFGINTYKKYQYKFCKLFS